MNTKAELKREQILTRLRNRGEVGATNAELSHISLRYGAHLGTLYQMGYKIEKESLGEGLYRYILKEEPEDGFTKMPKALDALKRKLLANGYPFLTENIEQMLDEVGIAVKYKPNTYNN
ncbi:hypothetical protein [Bacillus sp. ISTL8]|uniref:hypothetical protein n=1 Tax=Bacillus sp. ISTL8 TaxID=2596896 RepID=UPI001457626E|nr:hypothetical protein [Bacillus sp. ISTL8]